MADNAVVYPEGFKRAKDENRYTRMKEALEAEIACRQDLEFHCEKLLNENSDISEKILRYEHQLKELQESIADLSNTCEKLTDQKSRAEQVIQDTQVELNALREQIESLGIEFDSKDSECDAAKSKIARLKKALRTLIATAASLLTVGPAIYYYKDAALSALKYVLSILGIHF